MLGRNTEDNRIVLGLLELVERNSVQSSASWRLELGAALGVVNIYIRRCVKKGLLKIGTYITPQGFAEKARLTLDYLSYSFDLFKTGQGRLRGDCSTLAVQKL